MMKERGKRDDKENNDHPPLKMKSVLGEAKKNKKNK